jgi:hypothetical protein
MISRTISLLQKDASGYLIQSLSPPFRSGAVATGSMKLLQNVVAELMTIRGSVRFHPTYGCDLLSQIGVTNVISLSEASNFINLAVSDVQENMLRRIVGDESLDGVLSAIVVEHLEQGQDRISFTLRVHSRAGESISHDLAIVF